jgi:chromosome segregation ATPase
MAESTGGDEDAFVARDTSTIENTLPNKQVATSGAAADPLEAYEYGDTATVQERISELEKKQRRLERQTQNVGEVRINLHQLENQYQNLSTQLVGLQRQLEEVNHMLKEPNAIRQETVITGVFQEEAQRSIQDLLTDQRFLQEETAVPEIADNIQNLENLLENEGFLRENTAIQTLLEEEYQLQKDTIQDMAEFRESTISYHKTNLNTRRRGRLVESISISAIGIAVLLLAIALNGMMSSALSNWMSIPLMILLTLVGVGFIGAGAFGMNKSLNSQ